MKRTLFPVAAALFLSMGLWAQDDPEFANPEPDSKIDATKPVNLDTFTGQSLQFFETLKVDGYYVGGWKDSGEEVNTPVNALNFGFGSDVRLDRTARAYASFSLAYPNRVTTTTTKWYNPVETPVSITDTDHTSLDFEALKIKELFLDYSLGNLAIVRLGRQTATWGQGRIFNPGNLITGIGDGMAVKLSTALGPVAVTGLAIKSDSTYGIAGASKMAVSIESVGGAWLADYSSEWFSTGVSAFYHANIGQKADVYFKTSFAGADLFAEGLGEWGNLSQQSYTGLVGMYREFGEKTKWLKVQAEWLVSGQGDEGSFKVVSQRNLGFDDQTIGLAATSDFFGFVSTKPSVLWLHSLADHSGQVVLGFTNTSLPHIDLTLGLARIYGAADGRYVVNNPDTEKRTLSVTLKASFNFDIKS